MQSKYLLIPIACATLAFSLLIGIHALSNHAQSNYTPLSGAPISRTDRTILPETTDTYELGTSTKAWHRVFTTTLCLSGDCQSAWPAAGSAFSTTSALYFSSVGLAFSTTSTNYWKTQQTFTGASTTLLSDSNTWSSLQTISDLTTALSTLGTQEAPFLWNMGGDEYGIGRSDSDKSNSGRASLSFHVATARSFSFFSSSWTKLAEIMGGTGDLWIAGKLESDGTATSTFANGVDIAEGCFAIGGVCVGGGGSADGTFSTTSANYWASLGLAFSTTSADYWETQQAARGGSASTFSTTSISAAYPVIWNTTSAQMSLGFGTTTSNTWAGSQDFGGASFLEIPNGTGPTANDPGEIAHDTSDNMLILDDFVIAKATERIWGVTVSSTSPAFISAGLLAVPTQADGYTITRIQCHVTTGTSKVIAVEDASGNSSEDITCATTNTTDDGSLTNATYTASELSYIDFGATSGSVDYVTISVFGQWTRE